MIFVWRMPLLKVTAVLPDCTSCAPRLTSGGGRGSSLTLLRCRAVDVSANDYFNLQALTLDYAHKTAWRAIFKSGNILNTYAFKNRGGPATGKRCIFMNKLLVSGLYNKTECLVAGYSRQMIKARTWHLR